MKPTPKKTDSRFSARDLRALLWLLPVLAVASWLVLEIARPRKLDDVENQATVSTVAGNASGNEAEGSSCRFRNSGGPTISDEPESTEAPVQGSKLFAFDPNTVDFYGLMRLGFTRGEALGIIKYRERGKVFEIPEDFAACYQVSEAMYRRLQPYIKIGEKYRLKKFEWAGRGSTAGSGNGGDGATSGSGAAETRETEAGGEGHVACDGMDKATAETAGGQTGIRIENGFLELNSADSAALVSVVGIGAKTAVTIMEYRARLGGFAHPGQLAEVRGVTEQNYERIVTQIFVDPRAIQKIDINFAPARQIAAHPYIGPVALRKLLKLRQLKGGWRTVEELENDDIFTTEELAKLGPYLLLR